MCDKQFLNGRTALVTGGATRIGRAISLTLAGAGASVAVHYRSSKPQATEVVKQIEDAGGKAIALGADLQSEAACRELVSEASKAFDATASILINNASVFNRESIHEVTEVSITGEFWPNLFAPMLLTRFFAEGKPDNGIVINMLDRRIMAHDDRFFSYTLAKKGLAEFTRLAAVALAPDIKVHGVAPGPILPPPGKDETYLLEKGGKRLIHDRLDPSAIAEAVMTLLVLRGATGQILFIDNGQHLLGNGV